jgi:hypothetical protein
MTDYLGMALAENALLRKKLGESAEECSEWIGRYLDVADKLSERWVRDIKAADEVGACKWAEAKDASDKEHAVWETGCADVHVVVLAHGDESHLAGATFCPYCGKPIEVQHD